MRNFVKQLRAKLGEDAADPAWIHNVRGIGYRMPRPEGEARGVLPPVPPASAPDDSETPNPA